MSNPLDPILAWYTTAKDSIRVTRRVVDLGLARAVTSRHSFHGRTPAENGAALAQAQEELDRLAVLALVAVFERALRDRLAASPVVPAVTGDPFDNTIRAKLLDDLERWRLADITELFTGAKAALRTEVGQIIKYRNWVAHGKTRTEPAPLNITPAEAHRRLTAFLTQAKVI